MEETEMGMVMATVMPVVVRIDMDVERARGQNHFVHPQSLENQGLRTLKGRC